MKHGLSSYTNSSCRCEVCRSAATANHQRWKESKRTGDIPEHVQHGSHSTYSNWSCRCDECRSAHREYSRAYYAKTAGRRA